MRFVVAIATTLSCLALLAACSQKSDVEDALNAAFGLEPDCFRTDDPPELPLRLKMTRDHMPVLEALLEQKLISVAPDPVARVPTWVINVTQAGSDAKVWTPGKGFCVGRKIVQTVEAIDENSNALIVDYTWRYDAPTWAKQAVTLPGVSNPVRSRATIEKTKEGLKVRSL